MDLHKELLSFVTERAVKECDYGTLGALLNEFANMEAYRMLCEIYEIVSNPHIPEAACHFQIERIRGSFRERGIDVDTGRNVQITEHGGIPISTPCKNKKQ